MMLCSHNKIVPYVIKIGRYSFFLGSFPSKSFEIGILSRFPPALLAVPLAESVGWPLSRQRTTYGTDASWSRPVLGTGPNPAKQTSGAWISPNGFQL